MTAAEIMSAAVDREQEIIALKERNRELLAAIKSASELIGEIPSGTLGTQEPAYKALVILDAALASQS